MRYLSLLNSFSKVKALSVLFTGFLLAGTACGDPDFKRGEALYTQYCANCHMADGTGLGGNIPPLKGADYLAKHPAQVACIIRYGLADTILVNGRTYAAPMLAIPTLNEFEIANIINYINHSWGNDLGYTPLSAVQQSLDQCAH